MVDGRKVLRFCPNFYQIINFNPITGDELTGKIIQMYKDYIFNVNLNNPDDINEIRNIDAALVKYLDDYSFRGLVQKKVMTVKVRSDCNDVIKFFIDLIVKIFKGYDEYTTRVITISRWI